MFAAAFLASVLIAFPKEGARLPAVSACYMIGSVDPSVTNLTVQGRSVEVHPMGGWVTMVSVTGGVNSVAIEADGSLTNLSFTVALPPTEKTASAAAAPNVYQKLPYAGDEPRPHPSGKSPSEMTVVIDAGHGGNDSGTVGPHGLPEKDVNLHMARALRSALEKRGYKVAMTRDSDVALGLYERPKRAYEVDAEAFISIHHNAPPANRDPRNFRYHAVYSWNGLGKALADRINSRMAEAMSPRVRNNGSIHANYAVTRNPEIPSCLIEIDFLTTPEAEIDCWNAERRRQIAEAIAAGFADWCR